MTERRGRPARWTAFVATAPVAAGLFAGTMVWTLGHDPFASSTPKPVAPVVATGPTAAQLRAVALAREDDLNRLDDELASVRQQAATVAKRAKAIAGGAAVTSSSGTPSSSSGTSAGSSGGSSIVVPPPAAAPPAHTTTGASGAKP